MNNSGPDFAPEYFLGLAGVTMLIALVLFAVFATLMIWSLVWVAQDAEARNRPAWLLVLLMLVTWPLGLLVWLVARPPLHGVPPPFRGPPPPPLPP